MAKTANDAGNPYVGPVPFGIQHKDYFFGRDLEAKLLYASAIAERIVLFYAKSGVGKTSLINTRLIPSLKEKYQVLPVVRVGRDLPPRASYDEVENVFTFNTLLSLGVKGKLDELKKKPLAAVRHDKLIDIDFERPHWLIIDQFEEIVTTHAVQSNRRADFFYQLSDFLEADKQLSVVLAMREEYLADVYDYAPRLPGRLKSTLRMTALNTKAASSAIWGPAQKQGREFSPEATKWIVDDLSQLRIAGRENPINSEHVDPLSLQIVCYTFWKRLDELAGSGMQTSPVTLDLVKQYAKVDEALERFYDVVVGGAVEKTSGATEAELRRWIGEKLITPSGIRAQVNRGYFKTDGLSNNIVDYLQERFLLRLEESRGGEWYELAHDRFISPILQSNKKWLAKSDSPLANVAREWVQKDNDESLLYRGRLLEEAVETYDDTTKLTQVERDFLFASTNAEKRRIREKRVVKAGLALITVLAVGFAFYGRYQKTARIEERAEFTQEQKLISEKLFDVSGVTAESLASFSPTPIPSPNAIPDEFVENSPIVGTVHWRLQANGEVEYLNNWEDENIITVEVPQLIDVPGANNGRIQFNKLAANQLKAAWQEIEAAGLLDQVLSWQGSLARKSVKGKLSSHALGLAFDMNYQYNPSGVVPQAEGEIGSVRELVPIFQKYGFAWGGNWKVPDGGHFEVVRIVRL